MDLRAEMAKRKAAREKGKPVKKRQEKVIQALRSLSTDEINRLVLQMLNGYDLENVKMRDIQILFQIGQALKEDVNLNDQEITIVRSYGKPNVIQ